MTAIKSIFAICLLSAAPAFAAVGDVMSAKLSDTAGKTVGKVSVVERADGLHVNVKVMRIPVGVHGSHIHTSGTCDAPDFTTAGGHWNPLGKQHGLDNPVGSHSGDIPNLNVKASGKGYATYVIKSATITGVGGLADGDGAAFVIHATADDNVTDPSGNSGARIACGVLKAR